MHTGGTMIPVRADLHMHTIYSDGALSPRELIERVKNAGLGVMSVTDHDHVAGVNEAIAAGEQCGVEVIPGVELSAHVDSREVHILGYFFDVENEALNDFLGFLRDERLTRAERMVEKLRAMNIPVSMEKVLDQAGEGSVGRPHIANAIIEEGFAESRQEVFTKYLGFGCPAYVEKFQCSPEEALSIISQSGGLSFLAHPGNATSDHILFRLIKAGLDGIETVHPSHSAETVMHYRGIAGEYYLLESGGSDFHGGRRNDDDALGRFTIGLAAVDAMRKRLIVDRK